MFNEDLKQRYIEEKEATTILDKGFLKRVFNKTARHEKMYKKDISCFTAYEIIDFYKFLNMTSYESLVVFHNQLSMYTQWCLQQNIVPDFQNHYLEINNEMLMQYINKVIAKKRIITRETLNEWQDQLPNPMDQFILEAIFIGIKGTNYQEIGTMKMVDFSGDDVYLCTGRVVKATERLKQFAAKSNSTLELYAKGTGRSVDLRETDRIVKAYINTKESDDTPINVGSRIFRRCVTAFEYLNVDKWMTPKSLHDSGKIDFINRRAKELNITGEEYINSSYVKEVEKAYDFKMVRSSFIRKYKEYLA